MTLTQERHVERFNDWLAQLRSFLTAERGRASRLAEHLGVRRQNVSRWFISGYKRDVPAWAALTANVWYYAQLVRLGSDKPLCPPGERQPEKRPDVPPDIGWPVMIPGKPETGWPIRPSDRPDIRPDSVSR